jgi:hypothetical protein
MNPWENPQINTGWLPDPYDSRDRKADPILGAVFDWDKGYRVEDEVGKIPHVVQTPTSSCVACTVSAYHWVLRKLATGIERIYSVRDPYSQIFVPPNGGAYIRDAMKIVCTYGHATEQVFPTPPWTETHLRDRSDADEIDKQTALANIGFEYRTLDGITIDAFAKAVEVGKGCAMAINSWGHAMYAKAAYLKSGIKTIQLHNSYGEGSDVEIGESYFTNGDIANPWIFTLKDKLMSNSKLVKVTRPGMTDETGFYLPAMSPDALKDKAMNLGITIPLLADGSIDWANLNYDYTINT